jgi:hypothetical protein
LAESIARCRRDLLGSFCCLIAASWTETLAQLANFFYITIVDETDLLQGCLSFGAGIFLLNEFRRREVICLRAQLLLESAAVCCDHLRIASRHLDRA